MQLKKILFTLFAAFLVYTSCSNLIVINNSGTNISNLKAVLFGIYFTFCATGIFAFTGFVFQTYKLIPEQYYKIRNPAFLKKICTYLGVHYFSKAVVAIFYNKKKIKATYFNGNPDGINAFITQTKQDEFGHIVPFVFISCYCVYLLFVSSYVLVLSICISNIVLNLYPVLMQRHHRTYESKD